jgi:hypothetical protein
MGLVEKQKQNKTISYSTTPEMVLFKTVSHLIMLSPTNESNVLCMFENILLSFFRP